MKPEVSIEGLGYRYRGQQKPALDGIDLEVAEGEFLVVMGPSGAGKSTLCVSLNGLIPHFFKGQMEGEVRVGGRSTREGRVGEFAQEVGLVFQDFEAQLFSTNVALEVAFGPENFQVEHEEMVKRVESVLRQVRLEGFEDRTPATLSGGQKQRLAIASVLAIQPRVLCLDEPTTDLDPIGKLGVFEIAEGLKNRDDVTLIVVEHETEETLDADRIIVLRSGKIAADRPAREILRDVKLLEESSVMPLQVARFFHERGAEEGQLPLTPEEGIEEFGRRGWRVSPQRHRELVEADKSREEGYGEPLIEVEGLTHRYPNGVVALEGVDLTVRRGEFLAVLGQNGSGKTTLVKHFNGLLKPTEGTVTAAGHDTRGASIAQMAMTVGYIFQNPDAQIFKMNVREEIAFGPQNVGLSEEEVDRRVREAAEDLEISHLLEKNPFFLSKGEKQRVAVAAVMAMKPDILVLDEPTTGQDFKRAKEIMDLAVRLHAEGQTVVVITHDMNLAAEYCDRVVIMEGGRVLLDAPTREAFLAEEELNASSLRPPQVTVLGKALGYPRAWLTVDEAVETLGDAKIGAT